MRTLTSLLCMSALLVGAAACGDGSTAADEPSPTTAPDSSDESPDHTAPSSTTTTSTAVPTTLPPDPLAVGSYLSTDGSRPALLPTCWGLFGACLGSSVDQLTALLGPAESRTEAHSGDGPTTIATWTLENQITFSVTHDAPGSTHPVGSIRSFSAELSPTSPGSRLGLPDGLVLGEATGDDVVALYGPGFNDQACENYSQGYTWICVYHYEFVDGTVYVRFGHRQEGQDIPEEERWRSDLVISFVSISAD